MQDRRVCDDKKRDSSYILYRAKNPITSTYTPENEMADCRLRFEQHDGKLHTKTIFASFYRYRQQKSIPAKFCIAGFLNCTRPHASLHDTTMASHSTPRATVVQHNTHHACQQLLCGRGWKHSTQNTASSHRFLTLFLVVRHNSRATTTQCINSSTTWFPPIGCPNKWTQLAADFAEYAEPHGFRASTREKEEMGTWATCRAESRHQVRNSRGRGPFL